ncbi:hypothetical protein HYDPIDRAFT_175281 [Hydnomerulius pinastri MD-312]|uniref:DUF431-domain-containing protein n=1 Tax=Hydnomerulius pinastri MD-312 TaxID=994086 RepID=A0A0C9WG31_9AGAM|nr:hypothetical protein HYDPIDRAFT_175281 [Hydnomerulius pinastri MD-312]
MGLTYVIEHMEEDETTPRSLPPWVELEYSHMISLAGPDAQVQFTHLSRNSCDSLRNKLASIGRPDSFRVHTEPIMDVLKSRDVPLAKVCLLDPKAERELKPEDGVDFDWFLFGHPGDDPPRDRTSELRQLGFPARHLGTVQMTTDTALGVTKRVVHDKIPLDGIPYVNFPTIKFNAKESVEMPFRYIADPEGEPLLPPGMRELLHEDLNKSFDF